MKKLILTAAIVCAAVVAQAATVKWNSGTVYTPTTGTGAYSSTKLSNGTGSAALYAISASDYTTLLAALTSDYATAAKSIYDTYNGTAALATATYAKAGFVLTDTRDVSTATSSDPIDLYAAVIYTYNDGKDDWFVANVGTQHYEANIDNALNNLSTKVGGLPTGSAITGWQSAAVPEPTSGLLLLLGVAGLALRRRRA